MTPDSHNAGLNLGVRSPRHRRPRGMGLGEDAHHPTWDRFWEEYPEQADALVDLVLSALICQGIS